MGKLANTIRAMERMMTQIYFTDEQMAARRARQADRAAAHKQDPDQDGVQPKGLAPEPVVESDPPKPKPKILEW